LLLIYSDFLVSMNMPVRPLRRIVFHWKGERWGWDWGWKTVRGSHRHPVCGRGEDQLRPEGLKQSSPLNAHAFAPRLETMLKKIATAQAGETSITLLPPPPRGSNSQTVIYVQFYRGKTRRTAAFEICSPWPGKKTCHCVLYFVMLLDAAWFVYDRVPYFVLIRNLIHNHVLEHFPSIKLKLKPNQTPYIPSVPDICFQKPMLKKQQQSLWLKGALKNKFPVWTGMTKTTLGAVNGDAPTRPHIFELNQNKKQTPSYFDWKKKWSGWCV